MSDDFNALFGYSTPEYRTAPPPLECGPNLLQEVALNILQLAFSLLVAAIGTVLCFGIAYAVVWTLHAIAMVLS